MLLYQEKQISTFRSSARVAPGAPKPSKLLLQYPVELPLGVTSLSLPPSLDRLRLRLASSLRLRLPLRLRLRLRLEHRLRHCRRERRVGGGIGGRRLGLRTAESSSRNC